jgi:DNA-binding XRE family transcriptional regulator
MAKETKRIFRKGPLPPGEVARLNEIRRQAQDEFPPDPNAPRPATIGVGAQVRAAREAQQLTWYSLAQRAGLPDPSTIRDIEYGRDAPLSNLAAIATALGLKLELVEEAV